VAALSGGATWRLSCYTSFPSLYFAGKSFRKDSLPLAIPLLVMLTPKVGGQSRGSVRVEDLCQLLEDQLISGEATAARIGF
jgi:hypothetical protein